MSNKQQAKPNQIDVQRTFSIRGFARHGTVSDDRAAVASVYESSVWGGGHVWLNVEGEAQLSSEQPPRPCAGIPGGVAPGSVAAHLSREQAIGVRDMLNDWLKFEDELEAHEAAEAQKVSDAGEPPSEAPA